MKNRQLYEHLTSSKSMPEFSMRYALAGAPLFSALELVGFFREQAKYSQEFKAYTDQRVRERDAQAIQYKEVMPDNNEYLLQMALETDFFDLLISGVKFLNIFKSMLREEKKLIWDGGDRARTAYFERALQEIEKKRARLKSGAADI